MKIIISCSPKSKQFWQERRAKIWWQHKTSIHILIAWCTSTNMLNSVLINECTCFFMPQYLCCYFKHSISWIGEFWIKNVSHLTKILRSTAVFNIENNLKKLLQHKFSILEWFIEVILKCPYYGIFKITFHAVCITALREQKHPAKV